MRFFSSSQLPWPNPRLPAALLPRTRDGASKPESRSWYDSSFDLAQGLDVLEQDDDALFQLWDLSLN